MSETSANPLDLSDVDPFEIAREAAGQIAEKTGVERHDIALTLGSGWGKAADLIRAASVRSSSAPGRTTTRTTVSAGSCTVSGPLQRPVRASWC
jgi:hypothetical protein